MTLPLISMRQITKRFPGVIANNKINLELYPGEIHALLGENGSGKSTLMSILTGLYKPTEGCIMVGGEEVKFASPADAIASGIGMVHQHFKLIESFTVAENIVLSQSKGGFLLKPEQIIADIESLGEKYGLQVDLDKVAPGMANADTLLYGVEVKFYSARLELDDKLETKIPNLFAVGDGAGITRGLSQASASGVHVARQIGARLCGGAD